MGKSEEAVSMYWNLVPEANILLYIDNSNMFESAKKYSGHKKGFINGTPDFLCRIDIGRLISKAVGGREVLLGKLYGSEPPALDTVWDAIRKKQVHVETFRRSKVTGKEKELDTSLVAAAVKDIIEQKDVAGDDRTVILFSGDRDLLCVVDIAFLYGYTVEIFAFGRSINKTVEQKANEFPNKLKIKYIDEFFEEITFHQIVWSHRTFPPERSIVASVNIPADVSKRDFFKMFVEKSWSIFFLPMMGKYIDGDYKHIVLIPCTVKSQQEITFNFYKHIQPYMHVLQEHFSDVCSEVITWKQFLDKTRKFGEDALIELSNKYERLQLNNIDDEDEDDDDIFFDAHSTINASISDGESIYEDFDEIVDNVEDHQDYVSVSKTKTKPRVNLYSKACLHKFWCVKGLRCDFKHTEQEREFFRLNPEGKCRKFYKIKPCYYKVCNFNSRSYLCPYAHDVTEARCICCAGKEKEPHWMDQCPVNKIKK